MAYRTVIEALRTQRAATLAQLAALPSDGWEIVCEGGSRPRVRDIAGHLLAVDTAAVTGRLLPVMRAGSLVELAGWDDDAVARYAEQPPEELRVELARVGDRLAHLAGRVPRAAAQIPVSTVLGRQPLGVLLARRVVNEWVRTDDIARATGAARRPAPGVPAVLTLGVLRALPALTLPHMEVSAGVVRLVVGIADGPEAPVDPDDRAAPRVTWSLDFARRQYGRRVSAPPDATVRLHATHLALVAAGRRHCDTDVAVDGDHELAATVLAELARAATRAHSPNAVDGRFLY
ncbi:hypothetical protein BH20ACT8_BH20ACT8_16820 [soil metagenome]